MNRPVLVVLHARAAAGRRPPLPRLRMLMGSAGRTATGRARRRVAVVPAEWG